LDIIAAPVRLVGFSSGPTRLQSHLRWEMEEALRERLGILAAIAVAIVIVAIITVAIITVAIVVVVALAVAKAVVITATITVIAPVCQHVDVISRQKNSLLKKRGLILVE
jgi:fatty acid desaturase